MSKAGRRQRGFTLVEVMVALLIVALAVPAVLTYLYQITDNTAYLRDRSLAQMVATNRLTELRLAAQAREQLPKGRENGDSEMANRQWHWRSETTATSLAGFYRVEIEVSATEEGDALYTLNAYIADPQATATPGGGGV